MYEDYVRRAILSGRGYDDLPPRVRASLPQSEWRARALAVCCSRAAPWAPLPAPLRSALPPERAYHEALLARHLHWLRPYPHHLAGYTARVLRVAPFAYYGQMLAGLLASGGAYADLPNLTARDATAHTGVGRNAFIAAANAARSRRLLWRVNRAAAAREALPQRPPEPEIVVAPPEGGEGGGGEGDGGAAIVPAPPAGGHDAPLRVEPWWVVSCVNVMEHELRELSPGELALLRRAAAEGHAAAGIGDSGGGGGYGVGGGSGGGGSQPLLLVGDVSSPAGAWHASGLGPSYLSSLWQRGLVYFDVPVAPGDRFVIPPLDSFVSNRDAGAPSPGAAAARGGKGGGGGGGLGAGVGGLASSFDDGAAFLTAEDRADPREALLQAALVASHARLTAADLAEALGADAGDVAVALALACRLGFALRVGGSGDMGGTGAAAIPASPFAAGLHSLGGGGGALPPALPPLSPTARGDHQPPQRDPPTSSAAAAPPPPQAVAVVVDTQAAGLLMMGALSPALKRVSVTLFEGGRIAADVVAGGGGGGQGAGKGGGGLVRDLWESHAAGAALDGDLKRLTAFAASLATLLEAAAAVDGGRDDGGGGEDNDEAATAPPNRCLRPVEVLRAETLAGLDPGAARRVLGGAYYALVPIAPLPGALLPLSPGGGGGCGGGRGGAVSLGAFSPEAASPWLSLLLYAAAAAGPPSLALVRGQRLSRLPPALAGTRSALLWPWDAAAAAADPSLAALLGTGAGGGGGSDAALAAALEAGAEEKGGGGGAAAAASVAAAFVEGGEGAVLAALNHMLARTAVLVQAWDGGGGLGDGDGDDCAKGEEAADVPLPLLLPLLPSAVFPAVGCASGALVGVALPAAVLEALRRLGLDTAVGFLRVVRRRGAAGPGGPPPAWVPLAVSLGVPLYRPALCREVCRRAVGRDFLAPARVASQARAQRALQRALAAMASRFGSGSGAPPAAAGRDDAAGAAAAVDLPARCLLFDGAQLVSLPWGGDGGGAAAAAAARVARAAAADKGGGRRCCAASSSSSVVPQKLRAGRRTSDEKV